MNEEPENGKSDDEKKVVNVDFVKGKKVDTPEEVTDPKKPSLAKLIGETSKSRLPDIDVKAYEEAVGIHLQTPPEWKSPTGKTGVEQAEEEAQTLDEARRSMAGVEQLVSALLNMPEEKLQATFENPQRLGNSYDVLRGFATRSLQNQLFMLQDLPHLPLLSQNFMNLLEKIEPLEHQAQDTNTASAAAYMKMRDLLLKLNNELLQKLNWVMR